jgi:hypothetical protein
MLVHNVKKYSVDCEVFLNPLTPELNSSEQRWLPIFLLGILIFKRLTARRLYKSLGNEGLIQEVYVCFRPPQQNKTQ